jgi:glycosyltransferase involved in cell wall biosynthesis
MRLAWFTPWPPQASGIAGRSVALVHALAERGHAVDVFVDHRAVPTARASDGSAAAGDVRVQSAHDFPWRHHRGQFDLAVYQAGNSKVHDFLWPYLFRYPGLTLLHDARLHHARARTLLMPGQGDVYREEFRFNQPTTSSDAAELAVSGFDGAYYYLWPMTRAVVLASRVVAVHARGALAPLSAAHPDRSVTYVPLGMGRSAPVGDAVRRQTRAAWRVSDDAVVFGLFGGLTAEKRVEPVMRAFARLSRRYPQVRLVLAGAEARDIDTRALAQSLNIAGVVLPLGVLDDDEFDRALAAIDVSVNLRWPTSLETSGPWVQALAAGRPTITLDLEHTTHVPALDPQTWRSRQAHVVDPVTISLELLDEQHSLGLAMDRLASDASLRARLSPAARRYWEAEHTVERMVDGCEQALVAALATPVPGPMLPAALRPDVWAPTREALGPFGDLPCALP